MPFDPNQPFETIDQGKSVVAPAFDPNQPSEPVSQPGDWKPLFSGVDSIGSQNPVQQKAVDFLSKRLTPDKELRAQAANMSYVSSKTPLPFSWMQQNWPSVRDAYAKEAGFTQGEPITDSTLYGHIGTAIDDQQHIHDLGQEFQEKSPLGRLGMLMQHFPEYFVPATKEKTVAGGSTSEGEAKGSWWQDINKPNIELWRAPPFADVPSLGAANPALFAGAWNGFIAPFFESLSSKLSLGTIGIGGVLGGASKAGVPLAKQALNGIAGIFTGIMAKDVVENAGPTYKKIQELKKDPLTTTQDYIEAVGPVITESVLGLLGAFHSVTEFYPRAKKVVSEIEGKNPQQAAEILRKEANTTPDPKAVDALNQAADKLEEIPSPAKDEAAVKEEMDKQEEAKVEPEPQPVKEPAPESNETASAPPPEPKPVLPAEVEKAFSIKNKAVAKTLKEMGVEPATKGQKNTWELAAQDAKEKLAADPEAGMKLVDELMQNPRPVTGNEDALLAHEVTRLELEREAAREHLKQAEASGDENAIAQAQERVRSAKEDYQNSADVFAQVGTANAHGLSFRAMMLKEDYSLAKMEREYTEATGAKELNPEQTKTIEDLHQKIKDTQAKFDAYRSRASELLMNPDFPGFKGRAAKPRPWIVKAIGEQAEAARERIRQRYAEGRVQSGLDPADLYDHAVIGAEHIVKGLDTFADWSLAMIKDLGDRVKPHLSEIWEKAREIKDAQGHEKFVKQQVKQLEKRIAELEGKLKVNDLSAKPEAMNRPSVREIENLKQARDALNEKMAEARKEDAKANAPTEEEQRLEQAKKRGIKTNTELSRRIAENDLTPKQRKEALKADEELRQIQAEGDILKQQYKRLLEKAEYDQMSRAGKIGRGIVDLYDAGRTIRATGEFSFVARQGAFTLASRPLMSLKAIPDTMRSWASNPTQAHAINLKVLNNPRLPQAREAGLHILDEHDSLNHKEELFAARMVGKIPLIKRFDQAATTFLNKVRFEQWDAMNQATSGSLEASAAVAKYVNEATGRGSLGGFERSAVAMARVMFSPRFFTSRLQYLAGHSLWDSPADARSVILKEYGRTAAGLAAYYAAQTMFLNMINEDEKKLPVIGTDPNSSDFLKIKLGNSRIDPLAGVQQMAVLTSRLVTGEITNSKGKSIPIRGEKVPFGGADAADVIGRFARGRLHPTAGSILNILSGKDAVGQPVSIVSELEGSVTPITYQDIVQAYQENDIPEATNLAVAAMFGVGLQTYAPTKKPAHVIHR